MGDGKLPWDELQRRALLAGIPANLPRDELEERVVDDRGPAAAVGD